MLVWMKALCTVSGTQWVLVWMKALHTVPGTQWVLAPSVLVLAHTIVHMFTRDTSWSVKERVNR